MTKPIQCSFDSNLADCSYGCAHPAGSPIGRGIGEAIQAQAITAISSQKKGDRQSIGSRQSCHPNDGSSPSAASATNVAFPIWPCSSMAEHGCFYSDLEPQACVDLFLNGTSQSSRRLDRRREHLFRSGDDVTRSFEFMEAA